MEIQAVVNSDAAEISLAGDLVAGAAEQLAEQLMGLRDQGVVRVVLDLRNVSFIDSSGLNVIIGAHKQLRAREGRLVLLSPAEPVRRVFRVTGAGSKLDIAATREECASFLGGKTVA